MREQFRAPLVSAESLAAVDEREKKEAARSTAAHRGRNREKTAISAGVLYLIWAAILVFLSVKAGLSPALLAGHLGVSLANFLIALVVAVTCTLVSKKEWTWGFAVFVYLIFVVPISLIA